ncbi:MAG: sigma-70 family RNA polymerase sigma factor [Planctomycetes bacterium]|nr:sigma-70 family RNA polymerase sigma factor [Planctomycetota bacterium]
MDDVEDDAELARRCAERDGEAWRVLLERITGLVRRVTDRACRRGGCGATPELVEEVLSRTVAELLRDDATLLRRYRPAWRLTTWIGAIAQRKALGLLAESARHARASADLDGLAAACGDPGLPAESGEMVAAVRRALERLPDRDRLMLLWVHGEGRSYRTVARLLGLSEESIGRLLQRARDRLRPYLLA